MTETAVNGQAATVELPEVDIDGVCVECTPGEKMIAVLALAVGAAIVVGAIDLLTGGSLVRAFKGDRDGPPGDGGEE